MQFLRIFPHKEYLDLHFSLLSSRAASVSAALACHLPSPNNETKTHVDNYTSAFHFW